MKVLSIDPGITTGYVIAEISDDVVRIIECGQKKLDHVAFWEFLEEVRPDYIVCESFEYRPHIEGVELFSRELIGIITLWYGLRLDCQLKMQTAAQGKKFWNNDVLKDHGYYEHTVGKEHGRDALRHFLYWYFFGAGYQYNTKGKEIEW